MTSSSGGTISSNHESGGRADANSSSTSTYLLSHDIFGKARIPGATQLAKLVLLLLGGVGARDKKKLRGVPPRQDTE